MAADKPALALEDLVTCVICQEVFERPIALRCMHTLCNACVDTLKRRSPLPNCVQCPICREMTEKSSLKHDFRMQNLVDLHNSQRNISNLAVSSSEPSEYNACQLCRKKSFCCKCIQCDKFLCESCEETHREIPSCHGHEVASLRELLTSCGVTLTRVADAMLRDRDLLVDKLDSLEEYTSDLERLQSSMASSLDISEEDMINKVRSHFADLRQELDSRIKSHQVKAEAAKNETLEVVDKVMQRSKRLAGSLSGAELMTLLSQCDDLKSEDKPLNSDDYILLPKWSMGVVPGKVYDTNEISSLVKLEARSEPKLLCGSKSAKVKHDKTFTQVLSGSRFLTADESTSALHKFKYCDQVTNMLSEIQRTIATHTRQCQMTGSKPLSASELSHIGKASRLVEPVVNPTALPVENAAPQVSSLEELIRGEFTEELTTHREIMLSKSDDPQCLRIVNDEIWCVYQDWVNVYDFDLSLKTIFDRAAFKGEWESGGCFLNMKAIARAHTGHYFQACDAAGLRILQPSRVFIRVLHAGSICDVIAENEQVFALDVRTNGIVVFKYEPSSNPIAQYRQSSWRFDHVVNCQFALTGDDTLGYMSGILFVCSFRNDTVYRFSAADGSPLPSIECSPSRRGPGHLWRPRICCHSNGAIIIADHYHNRLQVLSICDEVEADNANNSTAPVSAMATNLESETIDDNSHDNGHNNHSAGDSLQWRVLRFEPQLNFPWDAVIAPRGAGCGLVVLERCNWKHKLKQFFLPTLGNDDRSAST